MERAACFPIGVFPQTLKAVVVSVLPMDQWTGIVDDQLTYLFLFRERCSYGTKVIQRKTYKAQTYF